MYRPYRGQRAQRRRRILNLILVLLALLVIGGAVFLLFFQERMVYSSDGVRFELPWSKPAATQDQAPETPSEDAAQPEGGAGQADGAVTPDTAAQEPALAVSATPRLLEIPADKLGDAAYLAQVQALHAQGAINGAAIVVKDPAGALVWKSAFPGVQDTSVVSGADDALPAAVKTLQADGLSVTAVLYAYEDDLYAAQDASAALKRVGTSGNAWRTPEGARRLDPASDAANAYLTALVQELSEMGFNEVVLRGFGWPAEGTGRLDRVSYVGYKDAAARSARLVETLGAWKTAAGEMEVSVCVDDPAAENGVNEGSGQDLGALAQAAARIYVPMVVQTATSGDSIRTIVGRVPGTDVSRLVPIYSSKELAEDLFADSHAMYFSPSETGGDLSAYLKQ